MDDSEFIILPRQEINYFSFANLEVTPAESYQFTHFATLSLASKSDSLYPLNPHCCLCNVGRRGVLSLRPHTGEIPIHQASK